MPVPVSARWVSRASNSQSKSRFSSTLGGISRSSSSELRIALTVGSCSSPWRAPAAARCSSGSRRPASRSAARAPPWRTRSATRPTVSGFGSTRWNVSPYRSSSSMWAMWSIALATKSTGTMLVCLPSGPASGNHSGSACAQLLEQLEEVVGTVDLVHLAGLGVADHDRRAGRSAVGDFTCSRTSFSDSNFVAVVVVGQLLPLVEHVLAEEALVVAGHGDRARVVEAADLVRVGEVDRRGACRRRWRAAARLLVGLHVVDRGEVEEVVDRLVEALRPRARASTGRPAPARSGPRRRQPWSERVEPPVRALADEHVDGPVALQQLLPRGGGRRSPSRR